ncbi:Uncharacterised protein [Mycobacteroides abscessus subsp. abscessus]|nr:Uncharacterised protein [Mycobacteroides abscessus subsp. abscessus]
MPSATVSRPHDLRPSSFLSTGTTFVFTTI